MKAEPSLLISRKLAANLEILIELLIATSKETIS